MLKRLNFSQYAYDWRHQHLSTFAEEIKLAKESKVHIAAVWMWIDKTADSPGKLSEDNERLLSIMKETGLQTQLWVGFNNNFYDYDNDATKIARGVEMLKFLREYTRSQASSIGLYNHGDWFGEPENQIKILNELNDPGVGLIYNFHHAHKQIDSFPALLKKMSPWLWTVNLNGMKKGGPQILPIGSGDEEKEMLKELMKSGFHGSIGILGHIEDEDVEQVLQRNLNGLRKLEKEL
jgi:sugar phosphate isomerase/epimerase